MVNMIRSLFYQQDGSLIDNIPPDEFQALMGQPKGMLWVDFQGESPEVCEPILAQIFKFHPLAIDDALQETHIPKLDDWDDYLYIVLAALTLEPGSGNVETNELDVFLGQHYIVTHHDMPIPAINRVWEMARKDIRQIKSGPDHLLYSISDELVVDFMHTVDEIDEEIELVEDQVILEPTPAMIERIFTLKRATLHLRRSLSPLREVFNKLARDEYRMIDRKDKVYFRDVYDHLVRLHDISESLRDMAGGVLDTYLSVVNNRMNEIMKTLTIITTLFMPLSFLSGFFGMNFFLPKVPITSWMEEPVFFGVLGILVLTPLIMFLWVRRRGWM
jgi:magnesium transporter